MKDRFNKEVYLEDNFWLDGYKKQIVLINTGTNIDDHLTKLRLRYNKKYTKVPTFTIDRNGLVYQHLRPETVSKIFDNDSLNKQAIVIALENVGWLTQDPDFNEFYDWSGTQYRGEVLEMTWRGKKFWAKYTEKQFLALQELTDYLCLGYSINKKFIGNNVLGENIVDFNGIINRSNFSKNHYDLTPAFEFEKFKTIINE
jgi:N-acetyl-anhydromuramyl-L-alanine amidase AmpD